MTKLFQYLYDNMLTAHMIKWNSSLNRLIIEKADELILVKYVMSGSTLA